MTKLKLLILFSLIGFSILIFNPVKAQAAIEFEGAVSTSTVAGSITSTTFAHTVGTGANRALFVGVGYADSNYAVSGVTYAGSAMTLAVGEVNSYQRSYIYYMVAPASGANNVVVTYAGTLAADDRGGVGAVSYTGVSQTNTINATSSYSTTAGVTTMEVSLTTTSANAWLFNNFWWGGSGTNTVKYSETKRWAFPATGTNNGSADKATTATGAYTTGWDGTASNSGNLTAVAFKEAVAGKRRIFISLDETLLKSVALLIKNSLWKNI